MSINTEIQNHIDKAYDLARDEVERLAREILRNYSDLESFIMAMGLATFSVKGKVNSLGLDERAYFKPLEDFIYYWDDCLKLTGEPMWIEGPDGPIKTEW